MKTHAYINILPLGSYDLLSQMDWLEKYRVMLDCYGKTFTCVDDKSNTIIVKGILRKVTIQDIYALQMKMYVRKGCK